MELIYTTQNSNFEASKNYRNPFYFESVERQATNVVVEGNFPQVVQAYQKAGIAVKTLEPMNKAAKPKQPKGQKDDTKDTK